MPAPSLPPSKKRKIQQDSAVHKSVVQLETDLTSAVPNNASLNSLADLLDLTLKSKSPQDTSKAIYALYRVFVLIITSDKLGLGGDDAAKVVKAWLWERLNTYVDYLGGLLKDEEKILRVSSHGLSAAIIYTLLGCSPRPSEYYFPFKSTFQRLIPSHRHLNPNSTSPTSERSCPSSSYVLHPRGHNKQTYHPITGLPSTLTSYTSSTRHGSVYTTTYDGSSFAMLRAPIVSCPPILFTDIINPTSTLLHNTPHEVHPNLASNLLSILERLTTFPTAQSELNAWWVPEMGTTPSKPKHTPKNKDNNNISLSDEEDDLLNNNTKEGAKEEEDDDWRKFFDDDPISDDGKNKTKPTGARLHTLTLHQSLHSLPSHRAVFTRAWLALLPRLSVPTSASDSGTGKVLATRALNVMHRGVMPHLTRPMLVMDWVGASVDFGRYYYRSKPLTTFNSFLRRWDGRSSSTQRFVRAHEGLQPVRLDRFPLSSF